jgi:hypothetical protein
MKNIVYIAITIRYKLLLYIIFYNGSAIFTTLIIKKYFSKHDK